MREPSNVRVLQEVSAEYYHEVQRLRALNAELVEALSSILTEATAESTQGLSATAAITLIDEFGDYARAALALAKGEKT